MQDEKRQLGENWQESAEEAQTMTEDYIVIDGDWRGVGEASKSEEQKERRDDMKQSHGSGIAHFLCGNQVLVRFPALPLSVFSVNFCLLHSDQALSLILSC